MSTGRGGGGDRGVDAYLAVFSAFVLTALADELCTCTFSARIMVGTFKAALQQINTVLD